MNARPVIPASLWEIITTHVEEAYPAEGCGLVIGKNGIVTRAKTCTNAQAKYHELDPGMFPRNERNAYFIEPRELAETERELDVNDEQLLAIYHSHPDAEAYFSAEDREQAVVAGEPIHPGTHYLVLSVREGKTAGHKWFAWDGTRYAEESSVGFD